MTNEERSALIAQGWTPPVAVDPDTSEALEVWKTWSYDDDNTAFDLALMALKRGRELERAEAQPGMVWVKHDGSAVCPIAGNLAILTKSLNGFYWHGGYYNYGRADAFNWREVAHYAIITQPENK